MSNEFFSPTVLYSYKINPLWHTNKCRHSEHETGFDDEGYDEYGFDKNGRDRVWKRVGDYKNNRELFLTIRKEYEFIIAKINYY